MRRSPYAQASVDRSALTHSLSWCIVDCAFDPNLPQCQTSQDIRPVRSNGACACPLVLHWSRLSCGSCDICYLSIVRIKGDPGCHHTDACHAENKRFSCWPVRKRVRLGRIGGWWRGRCHALRALDFWASTRPCVMLASLLVFLRRCCLTGLPFLHACPRPPYTPTIHQTINSAL